MPGPRQNEQSSRPVFKPRERARSLRAKVKAKTKVQKLALRLQATLGTQEVGDQDRGERQLGMFRKAGTGVEMFGTLPVDRSYETPQFARSICVSLSFSDVGYHNDRPNFQE